MSLPGHDPMCAAVTHSHSAYTCLNCQQADHARSDERRTLVAALEKQAADISAHKNLNDWELGYRKGLKKAAELVRAGGLS